MLKGPQLFSDSMSGENNNSQPVRFSWYEFEDADEFQPVTVRVTISAGSEADLVVDQAVYLLSMAQILDIGAPGRLPAMLSQYVAYSIVAPLDRDRQQIPAAPNLALDINSKSAALLCLPVEQWHHHDYFPVKSSDSCWIAYGAVRRTKNLKVCRHWTSSGCIHYSLVR